MFLETDPGLLVRRIAEHPFAVIAAVRDGRALAVHSPVIPSGEGEDVRLRFHLSAANAVTAALLDGSPALAVFTGPHAYISPDWYGMDDQVPTWNYISVEAEGPVTRLDETDTRQFLHDLSVTFENALAPKPVWTPDKMTPARMDALLRGIVAFDMVPTRLEGITKLNQNKPASARAGVAENLEMTKSGVPIAAAMRRMDS
ncbi:MAG: FMN-binding negative transcriptional regulator [Hyphomonas sp.]|nr:FMN-binding negative transcriptional regulator [Hyphomonas sp.]